MGNHDVWEDERAQEEKLRQEQYEKAIDNVLAAVRHWLENPGEHKPELRIRRQDGYIVAVEDTPLVTARVRW